MLRHVHLALPFCGALLLSCSTGTDPGDCTALECLPAQYNLHLTLSTDMDVDFTLQDVRYSATFLRPGNDVDLFSGPRNDDIRLGPDSDVRLPDHVTVNDFLLPPPLADKGEAPIYFGIGRDTILAPPGEYNVWFVGGAPDLPPYVDSIMTPADPVRVAAPLPTDTVRLGHGMEIRLEGEVSPDVPVSITVYQQSDGPEPIRYTLEITSTGIHRILADDLRRNGFGDGYLYVDVQQRRVQRRWIESDIRSNLSFTTEYRISCWMEN